MKEYLLKIVLLACVMGYIPAAHASAQSDLDIVAMDPFELDDMDLDPVEPTLGSTFVPVHTLMEDPNLPEDWTLDDIDVSDAELPYLNFPSLGPDFAEIPLSSDYIDTTFYDDTYDPVIDDYSLLSDPSVNSYWLESDSELTDMGYLDDLSYLNAYGYDEYSPYDTYDSYGDYLDIYGAPAWYTPRPATPAEQKMHTIQKGIRGIQDVVAAGKELVG